MAESPTPSLYTDISSPIESPFPTVPFDTSLTSLRTPVSPSQRTFDPFDDFNHDKTTTTSVQLFTHPDTPIETIYPPMKLEDATLNLSDVLEVRDVGREVGRHGSNVEVGYLFGALRP